MENLRDTGLFPAGFDWDCQLDGHIHDLVKGPHVEVDLGGEVVESTTRYFLEIDERNPGDFHKAEDLEGLGCEAIVNQIKNPAAALVWPPKLMAWLNQSSHHQGRVLTRDHKLPLTARRLFEELKKRVLASFNLFSWQGCAARH